jgi:hypothetical protein
MRLDLRRPETLEQLIADCAEKIRTEAVEDSRVQVEIMVGTEVMMELALRVMALEIDAGLTPPEKAPISAPQSHARGI